MTAVFDDTVKRVVEFEGRIEGKPEAGRYSIFGYRTEKGRFRRHALAEQRESPGQSQMWSMSR